MKRMYSLFIVFLVLALALSGCGSSDAPHPETTPPTVVSVSPPDNTGDVAVRPTISVTFSEAMNPSAAEGAFSIDPSIAGTFSWNGNTMIFTPDADLPYSVVYTATVGTGAKDLAGNALATAYSWTFTIRNAPDTTAPTVVSVAPVNGGRRVPLSSAVSVTFSEAMDQASAEAAFSGNPALPAGTFSWTGNTMTFTPGTPLAEFTQYTITVGTGAKDLAGNFLAAPFTSVWKTALTHKIVTLTSAFGATATSNGGVFPSADGEYIWWWDGTSSEGPANIHLYRVKISDQTSVTLWTDRSIWGHLFDDGTFTWVGNYGPYTAAKISNADLSYLIRDLSLGHTVGLSGNIPGSDYVYFSTTNWGAPSIGYWKKSDNTSGSVTGAPTSGYVRQSAVIGSKIYFPKDGTTPGIMVIDTAVNPTAVQTTLLPGNAYVSSVGDIFADDTHLYVIRGSNLNKIDPTGTGSVIYSFSPGAQLVNPVVIGDFIYAGSSSDKYVYIIDKYTKAVVKKDCSAYLPGTVGTPKWDFANDGIWYGPQNNAATNNRVAYFLSRSLIESCPTVP